MQPRIKFFSHFSLTVLALVVLATAALAQTPLVIPAPAKMAAAKGEFTLLPATTVYVSDAGKLGALAEYLRSRLQPATGLALPPTTRKGERGIELVLLNKNDSQLGDEGYALVVSPERIEITGNAAAGIFYGIQTLLQLLPADVESTSREQGISWKIPAVSITDYPRFAWRGVMLDVSRHFFSKDYVKEYIDQLARYKYNRLHLHLTDDQGWRLEVKAFPRLTSVGAWRVPRTGTFGSHQPPKPGEKPSYGGFYTQEDMREIIAYAKSRFIEILPEIDVPGHSMAAIAAYPYLSVTKDTTIRVNPGSDFATWYSGGKFVMHIDNTLNPTDEKVYEFLDKVVTEVAALFPFEYIHMGGDECYTGFWEKDPQVQAFMKKHKLKDGHALQAYFTDRVNKIVKSKNKKLIGWDEILEGGLSADAAVMSWQGVKGGVKASKQGHMVVMSPNPEYYLDMGQGDPSIEPPIYNYARLKDVYHFNILPPEADSTFVAGGQGNLWTEQVPTPAQVEYMTYPRAFAIAETLWSPRYRKEWTDFVRRTEHHLQRLDERGVNYSTSFYDPIIGVSKNKKGNLVVELSAEVGNAEMFYTLDNTVPGKYSPRYTAPVEIDPEVDNFRVLSHINGKPVGRLITLKREDLAKRVRKK